MADTESVDNRLAELEARWQAEPKSRVFLQLAEEYRRAGRLDQAIEVLEGGLKHRPNDLSGMVALGRCRLEQGSLPEAIEALEAVLQRDGTHLVANKLLVEANLQKGDSEKAQERLNIYRILNDRDPELEHLEYRLASLREGSVKVEQTGELEMVPLVEESEEAETVPPTAVAVEEFAIAVEAAEPRDSDNASGAAAASEATAPSREVSTDDPFSLPRRRQRRQRPSEDLFSLAPRSADFAAGRPREDSHSEPPSAAPGPAAEAHPAEASAQISPAAPANPEPVAVPAPTGVATAADEPFGALGLRRARRQRPKPGLAELFADLEPATPDPVVEPEAPQPMVEEEVAPRPAAQEARVLRELPVKEKAPSEPEPAPTPAESESVPLETVISPDIATVPSAEAPAPDLAEPEGADSAPVEGVPEASGAETSDYPTEVHPTISAPYSSPAPAAAEASPERPAAPPEEGSEAATATLGELYLEQGHLQEAERIFRRVLIREPGHAGARAGLERILAKKFAPLTVEQLLDGEAPAGLTAKKVAVLKSYLQQLRRASDVH